MTPLVQNAPFDPALLNIDSIDESPIPLPVS
jgi:hypothetical protein